MVVCNNCGKSVEKVKLAIHNYILCKVVSNLFGCRACSKTFKERAKLDRHCKGYGHKLRHGDKPGCYCAICNDEVTYKTSDELQQHIFFVHRNKGVKRAKAYEDEYNTEEEQEQEEQEEEEEATIDTMQQLKRIHQGLDHKLRQFETH